IKSESDFCERDILSALAVISAEERKVIQIKDHATLLNSLEILWRRLSGTTGRKIINKNSTCLTEHHADEKFHNVTIITNFSEISEDDQKLLLRLRILFIDLIVKKISQLPGGYIRGHSTVLRKNDSMAFMTQYTFAKNIGVNDIEQALADINRINVYDFMTAIRKHFKVFISEPLWNNMPIEYFRDTGITTSNKEIASLANEAHVQSLLDNVSFKVRESSSSDSDYIN
ncbi:MAG TPA: hypothetical protein VMQ58_02790, partial [Candidatus Saccharimonadales bacterium]|nr:hypothetical protein [Candidatus Saccharimonadales bacterium]